MRPAVRVIFVATLGVGTAWPAGRLPAAGVAMRYQEAWYLENGLGEVARAAELYREVAASPRAEPALAAKALLRLAACFRYLGQEDDASRAELLARRRFPEAIKRFPSYRLGALHKQLDEAFGVGDATAGRAIERFLEGLDVATVHSICEACYRQADELRARRRRRPLVAASPPQGARVAASPPQAAIAALRKAIAISTYLRQLERSAFAQKDIGDIHAATGHAREAIAAYRKVQTGFPTRRNVAAWAGMGIAEMHRLEGRLAEAVEAYRAVVREYPDQLPQVLWATLWMGDTFRAAGKMADAQAAWRRVLEEFNEPDYAGQIAIAARLLGQAAIKPPRMPNDEFANDRAYFLAVHHELAGEPEKAVTDYERCIALSKGHDWPRALAARALEAARRAAKP